MVSGSDRTPSPAARNRGVTLILIGLIGLGLGLLFSTSQPGLRLDGALFDGLVRTLGRDRPSDNIVVVTVGEEEYRRRATPLALWGLHLAPLLDKLAGAGPKAVGLDMVLPRFAMIRLNRQHDRTFFRSLKKISRTSRLISGYGLDPAGRPVQPFIVYQRIIGPDNYGYFNLTPDRDGVSRSQTLALAASEGEPLVCFAARLAGLKPETGRKITPDWRHPAAFKTLKLDEALAAGDEVFRDKTVLIGFVFDFEDRHDTPLGRGRPGVLIQAQTTEALMTGRRLVDPGRWPSLIIPAVLAVLTGLLVTRRPTMIRTALTAGVLLPGLIGLTGLALSAGLIIRPSAALAATMLVLAARLGLGLRRVRSAFGKHVTPQVRDEVLSGRIPLDGQTREVSALFSDLRNFTPMVESSDPKEVIRILNGYFEVMSTAITDHGGTVMQYVGDEIYAVFGAPGELADHPARAVDAGLAMRRGLADYNRSLADRGLPPLDHGIGVHTGPAVAAVIGGGGRLKYALVGDTINLASRLQGLNKEFGTKFIISRVTLSRLEDPPRVRDLGAVDIKGKSAQVEVFEVPDPPEPGNDGRSVES